MLTRERIERCLLELSGPMSPFMAFVGRVVLGLLAIPIWLVGYSGLWIWRTIVQLHWFGDATIRAVRNFYTARPGQ